MPKTTAPTPVPAEILAKFEQIKDFSIYYCSGAKFSSSGVLPVEGTWVLYRERYKDPEWHLTQIIKIDAKKIVKTTSGINFSCNRSNWFLATKRIGDSYNLPELYNIDWVIECYQVMLAKEAATQCERNLRNLQYFVDSLKAHEQAELVQELLEILKSKGVGK